VVVEIVEVDWRILASEPQALERLIDTLQDAVNFAFEIAERVAPAMSPAKYGHDQNALE
jgi:hypothetical protein